MEFHGKHQHIVIDENDARDLRFAASFCIFSREESRIRHQAKRQQATVRQPLKFSHMAFPVT